MEFASWDDYSIPNYGKSESSHVPITTNQSQDVRHNIEKNNGRAVQVLVKYPSEIISNIELDFPIQTIMDFLHDICKCVPIVFHLSHDVCPNFEKE